jgi:excinuclease UvrABC nuclease subunit
MSTELVNLSETDLDDLPERKAVYAIFAQSGKTGKPINCRYVGETTDLRARTRDHLSDSEKNDCLREFMQSNSMRLMQYELMPDSTKEERVERQEEWIKKHTPRCNE